MSKPRYVLKEDYLSAKKGTVFYRCELPDYGCKSDDERGLGEECLSLTEDPEGGYPFLIVPRSKLGAPPEAD